MTLFSRTFFLVLCTSVVAQSQYLDPDLYDTPSDRFGTAGVVFQDFQPLGSNPQPDSAAIRFNTWLPMFSARQGLVEIHFGYGRYDLSGSRKSTIVFGLSVGTEMPLSKNRQTPVSIPLSIGVNYMKAEAIGPEKESFNIASTGLGLGVILRIRGSQTEFRISASEFFHYSFEGFNTGSGFSAATIADATMFVKNWLVLGGVALGYRFRYQTWSMTDKTRNYKSLFHGPFIAVAF